jgi:hypothetical protein
MFLRFLRVSCFLGGAIKTWKLLQLGGGEGQFGSGPVHLSVYSSILFAISN